ncbi:MAG: DUF938 domain-containing protein [Rhodospirillales bacterium]|nr:DUF938 domain-containing protein [Rhodospirillales bacterium]
MAESSAPFDAPDDEADPRLRFAPACARNREPIADVLKKILPPKGLLLEISAGTGQHAVHFAPLFPGLSWQPSDPNPEMRASIAAWTEKTGAPNIRAPLDIETTQSDWPIDEADAVFSANMIHIAPWACCEGLLAGAGRILSKKNAALILYGPFKIGGRHTAASNAAFDDSLRSRDPAWGVRDLDAVAALAKDHGLNLTETHDMPADNLTVVFKKQG